MNTILIFVFGSIFLAVPGTEKDKNHQKNSTISTHFTSHTRIIKQNNGFEVLYDKVPHYLKSKK